MNIHQKFPRFEIHLSELNKFILDLITEYNAGKIKAWDDLEEEVHIYFSPEKMEEIEAIAPGWKKMASYSNGVTLTHVICVFLGLFMLPEFQALTPDQQQLAKWIVLFHDVDKFHIRGKRDHTHAFRSAVVTANTLHTLGFPVTSKYQILINSWSELTKSAFMSIESSQIQDNSKLPDIVSGIENIFGESTPSALIVKGVLFHMSINVVEDWPQAAPLSDDEIAKYIDNKLLPLLRVMNLADNEGWTMFYPEYREKQYKETVRAFEKMEKLVRK